MEIKYRAEATTLEGFIQQLAVGYLCRGYRFYFQGLIPTDKDPRGVDAKLIARYGLAISKFERAKRKAQRPRQRAVPPLRPALRAALDPGEA